MILYKYFPPERVDVLMSKLVRFTPPSNFNDPFDCAPAYRPLENSERAGSYECCALASNHIVQSIMHGINSNSVGVLSLSEVMDDILLWSHYSRNHTGFVVGFDTADPFFAVDDSNGSILRQVEYSSVRPTDDTDLSPYRRGPVFYFEPMNERSSLHKEWLYHKSAHWAYEREWRFVKWLMLDDDEEGVDKLHLFPFPASAIACVVLGCRAWNTLFPIISRMLQDNTEYDHVKLFETNESDTHYELEIEEFPGDGQPYGPWARALKGC